MQARLILMTLFLTAITEVFGGLLDKLQNASECPEPEEIPKCRCSHLFGKLTTTCKGPMTDSEFQSILKTLQEYSHSEFKITNYHASSISTDLWKGQHIDDLVLINVEVDDKSFIEKGKRHFQGLENSLLRLIIENSFKSKRRPLLNLQLDHLKELFSVKFENNNIPEVGNDWFTSGPERLTFLEFQKNGIIKLGDEAFNSLSRLKYLTVTGNHLSMVSRSMLPKSATLLSFLDLSYNQIRTLPNDIFSEMPALKDVFLNNNLIQTIEEDTWKSLARQVSVLNLEGNPLQCDEKMKWICKRKFIRTFEYEGNKLSCSSPPDKKDYTLRQFCGMNANSMLKEG